MKTLAAELIAQRDAILNTCDALTDSERTLSRTAEGWSIQDFVGHLSYWEQFTLECIRDTFKHGRPTPLASDTIDDDFNERAAALRKDWSWQRIRAEFENTRNAVIQRIDALSDADLQFYVPSPWVNDTRMISVEVMVREDVLRHGEEHMQDVLAWRNARSENVGE